ncbi:hypothetical protein [Ramlibacter sp. AN1133]|uniref:hypothetical protein n=1 Tax=Ramlibacter sp. AN1133 TaxID=3133429 RepID=UPI0030BF7A7A
MPYISAFVTHFRALQAWAARNNAALDVDLCTFQLEVKCRNRYFCFHPQFVGGMEGRIANTAAITGETSGFIGWLPYRPLSYAVSTDKLLFKEMISEAGLRTPARWSPATGNEVPDREFILKRSSGSFGYDIAGPFKAGTVPDAPRQQEDTVRGTLFAEQFIRGSALKVWCWGQKPFFAHLRRPATVTGDGRSSLEALIRARLAKVGVALSQYPEVAAMKNYLAYQGFAFDAIPKEGEECSLDFRYGREHSGRSNLVSDNELPALPEAVKRSAERASAAMARIHREMFPVPVLYSLDAVVDEDDETWWLEVNSNPVLPPEGYEVMFADLFA